MKWPFKSKLRKNIEFHIEMCEDSLIAIDREIEAKKIKQTLNPHEYAKYSVMKKDIMQDIELLKSLL